MGTRLLLWELVYDHPNESRNSNVENMLHHGDLIWPLQWGKSPEVWPLQSLGPLLYQFSAQVLTYKVRREWKRKNPTHLYIFQWLIMPTLKRQCLIWFFFFPLFIAFHMCRNYFLFSRGNIDTVLRYQILHLILFIAVWILSSVDSVWSSLFEGLKQLTPVECLALDIYGCLFLQ